MNHNQSNEYLNKQNEWINWYIDKGQTCLSTPLCVGIEAEAVGTW